MFHLKYLALCEIMRTFAVMLYRQSKATLAIVILLLLLTACYSGRRHQYLALLDQADSLNRAYAQMPPDSLLREAADFFDRHGSADERVRAHYLLGCAYRDLGQAPEALQAWQDALDRADTLTTDSASLQRLMAVYGQMTDLFHAQNLPDDEIKASNTYSKIALLAKDTLKYLRNEELSIDYYFLLGDTSKVISTILQAQDNYERIGHHTDAVRATGTLIYYRIRQNRLEEAKQLMDEFEEESLLFDSCGNISKGREIYYYFKGIYYLKKNEVDSAEYFMRKLINTDFRKDGFRGLLSISRERLNVDSIISFSYSYEDALDSISIQRRTETIHQMSALYDYTHFQKTAYEIKLSAERAQKRHLLLTFVLVVSILLLSVFFAKMRREKLQTIKAYEDTYQRLANARRQMENMQNNENGYRYIIDAKKAEIERLETELSAFKPNVISDSAEMKLKNSEAYAIFHEHSEACTQPSENDWAELEALYSEILPVFSAFMKNHKHQLSHIEYRVCLLSRLHFRVKTISILLGVSISYVSKMRSELAETLFQTNKKGSLFEKNLLRMN